MSAAAFLTDPVLVLGKTPEGRTRAEDNEEKNASVNANKDVLNNSSVASESSDDPEATQEKAHSFPWKYKAPALVCVLLLTRRRCRKKS